MLSREIFESSKARAAKMIMDAGIVLSESEIETMDVADFGLSDLESEGAQIVTMFSTDRVSAKIIALFPFQTEPEHWHTAVGTDPGKEETLRVAKGTVYMYIPGEGDVRFGFIPKGKESVYTSRKEVVLNPGEQITLEPGIKHWFQAGSEGAVMYTISSCARDALDPFTDPKIVRVTQIID